MLVQYQIQMNKYLVHNKNQKKKFMNLLYKQYCPILIKIC